MFLPEIVNSLAVVSHYPTLLRPTRLFQLGGDLEDLESALNKSSQTRPLGSGSCSALIKLLPNNKELLVSHDTWNTYQAMLRIMKKYIFAFKVSPSGSLLMQVCLLFITAPVLESLIIYMKGGVQYFGKYAY